MRETPSFLSGPPYRALWALAGQTCRSTRVIVRASGSGFRADHAHLALIEPHRLAIAARGLAPGGSWLTVYDRLANTDRTRLAGRDYESFEVGEETPIWRYVSLDRFESLLKDGLYFAAATQFDDDFEGAITEAEDARRRLEAKRMYPDDVESQNFMMGKFSEAFEDLRRMTKLSCWHESTGHENVAMWERYVAPDTVGVAVISTAGQLKASLQPFRLEPNYGEEPIVVGKVRYLDYANDTMDDETMLGIFMHKRIEYRDEREVRAILSLRIAAEFGVAIPDGGVFVGVDLGHLISEVRLSPHAQDEHRQRVRDLFEESDLTSELTASSLSKKPAY